MLEAPFYGTKMTFYLPKNSIRILDYEDDNLITLSAGEHVDLKIGPRNSTNWGFHGCEDIKTDVIEDSDGDTSETKYCVDRHTPIIYFPNHEALTFCQHRGIQGTTHTYANLKLCTVNLEYGYHHPTAQSMQDVASKGSTIWNVDSRSAWAFSERDTVVTYPSQIDRITQHPPGEGMTSNRLIFIGY